MKMKKEYNFIYAERNGNAVLNFSIGGLEKKDIAVCEADLTLEALVKNPNEWRLDEVQDEEGNEVEI